MQQSVSLAWGPSNATPNTCKTWERERDLNPHSDGYEPSGLTVRPSRVIVLKKLEICGLLQLPALLRGLKVALAL